MAKTKFKIIVIATCYPTKENPSKGIFSHQLLKSLQKIGCECHVMMPVNWYPPFGMHKMHVYWDTGYRANQNMYDDLDGVKIHHPKVFMKMPSRIFPNTNYWEMMGKAIARYCYSRKELCDADLIFSHFICTEGFSGIFVKNKLNIPHVSFVLGDDVHAWPEKDMDLRNNLLSVIRNADLLVANSKRLALDTQKWMNEDEKRPVYTVYHGVDYHTFKPIVRVDSLYREFELEKRFSYICCIATGTYLKGWNELLDALVELKPNLGQWKLICVSSRDDNGYVLDEEIQKRGLNDVCIKFAGMPHVDINKILQISDAFILPSYNEGLSNSVLEAMASCKVVITTDVGGHSEVISEENGILIQPYSKDEVVRGLNKFFDMTELERSQMGGEARARMINLGDFDENAKLMFNLFKQLCHV